MEMINIKDLATCEEQNEMEGRDKETNAEDSSNEKGDVRRTEDEWSDVEKAKEQKSYDMRMTNIYRLNEVLHRLIKKHKGNKNIQQTDRTFTFIL